MSTLHRRWATRIAAAATVAAVALGAAACGSSTDDAQTDTTSKSVDAATGDTATGDTDAADDGDTGESDAPGTGDSDADDTAAPAGDVQLTVYSGQHEEFAQQLVDAFTDSSGIAVTLRSGDDAELANQIIEEGDGSPADVFLSEEPGPVAMLGDRGLTSDVNADALGTVDQRLVPSSGAWLPYAARARVMYYNPELIDVDDLPASIMDLADPQWKGRFAYAPSGAFTSTVSYLISSIGADATLDWLKAIKENGVNEQKNGKVRDSVEAGQHEFGLSNHYYWYILAAQEGGADNLTSKVYFFDHEDAGGLLLTSGAAVLKTSANQEAAQQFLTWLVQADGGQQEIANATSAQFPVTPGVSSNAGIPPLSDLAFPDVDPVVYADTTQAKELIIASGIA